VGEWSDEAVLLVDDTGAMYADVAGGWIGSDPISRKGYELR
jgi:hypothetical protein